MRITSRPSVWAIDDVLLIGLSSLRDTAKARNLPIFANGETFQACVAVVERSSGKVLGMIRFPQIFEEVFDIAFVPDVRRLHIQDPGVDGLAAVKTPGGGYWMAIAQP